MPLRSSEHPQAAPCRSWRLEAGGWGVERLRSTSRLCCWFGKVISQFPSALGPLSADLVSWSYSGLSGWRGRTEAEAWPGVISEGWSLLPYMTLAGMAPVASASSCVRLV